MTQSVSGQNTVDMYYDGAGLRYGKTINGGDMTISLYEYSDVILEVSAATGAQTAVNVYGNQLISRNGQFYMYNGGGDVTAILDANSNIIASYYYDVFGVHKTVTGTTNNPYRYAGYMFDDETGLYYLKSRYYDPETARFLQEDTYKGQANDPLSLNLYAYVSYNPLKYIDPTGHWQVGDELYPENVQKELERLTALYFEYEKINNTKGMNDASKQAQVLRDANQTKRSLSNVNATPAGAALTKAIQTNGYLTYSSFNQIIYDSYKPILTPQPTIGNNTSDGKNNSSSSNNTKDTGLQPTLNDPSYNGTSTGNKSTIDFDNTQPTIGDSANTYDGNSLLMDFTRGLARLMIGNNINNWVTQNGGWPVLVRCSI